MDKFKKVYLTNLEKKELNLMDFPYFNVESELFRLAYSIMVISNEVMTEYDERKIDFYIDNLEHILATITSYTKHLHNFTPYSNVEYEEEYLKFISRVKYFINTIKECKQYNNDVKLTEYYDRILDYYELLRVPVEYVRKHEYKDEV